MEARRHGLSINRSGKQYEWKIYSINFLYNIDSFFCCFSVATVSIPTGMVQDQFGMIGLLTFIRGAETDPSLVALALGR